MAEFSNVCSPVDRLKSEGGHVVILCLRYSALVGRIVDILKSKGYHVEIMLLRSPIVDVHDKFGSYPEMTGEVTVDRPSEEIRKSTHLFDFLYGSYPEKTGEVTEGYIPESFRSHFGHKFHVADKIGPPWSGFLCSDPGKFNVPDKFGYFQSHYLGSDPGKFHFAEKSEYVQLLRSPLFDPNYKGAADRFRSDSAYKEAIQNTGMSGASAGAGKGTDGESTKDDEAANKRTIAWKLGLSVEAVTPKFIVSAKISLEKKSGSGN